MSETIATTALSTTTSATPPDPDIQRAAFELLRDEIAALPSEQLVPINVDVTYAIAVALGTANYLGALRDRVEALSHELDTAPFWKLSSYAYALSYAHGDYLFATTSPEELPALHEEGTALKELLLASAIPLSMRGLLPNEQVIQLKNPAGYRNLAEYLTGLSKLYIDHWTTIAGKSPVELAEARRASEVAAKLLSGAGTKARNPLIENEAALVRQRAFTLLVRTYDQVRRAITFLRWNEGDAERLAPSLYGGRGNAGGRRKDNGTDVTDKPSTGETSPDAGATVGEPGAPATPAPSGHHGMPSFLMKPSA